MVACKSMGAYGHPLSLTSMLSLCCLCKGACRCMGACGHLLCLTKYPFFVLCMYMGHPNIIQIYGGIQTLGLSKHTGASKHTGGHPNICGHPNVWGHMDTPLVWCFLCVVYVQGTSKHGGTQFFCIILNCICHLEFLLSFFFNFTYFIHFSKYPFEFCTIGKLVC